MARRVTEAVARPVRGVAQGGVAWVVLELIEAYELYDFTDRQWGVTLLAGGALVSFVQNWLENRRGKGFFLRDVPPKKVVVAGT